MLSLIQNENQKVYFTSDWHYNHKLNAVWESRGFSSVKAHDDAIIETVNSIVRPTDILFNLGDLTLNSSLPQFEDLISRINCQRMYLLWGNHPNAHYKGVYLPLLRSFLEDKYFDGVEMYPIRYKNIIYIGHHIEIAVDGKVIVLNHYSITSWNHMNKGGWMLHGHEHSAVKDHLPDGTNGKILDVGWDYFKKPITFDEVEAIMDKKSIISVGHH